MPLINLDLGKALTYCPATRGIGPYTLKTCMTDLLSTEEAKAFEIKLDNGGIMQFIVHQKNDKMVITSLDSLSTGCPDGFSLNFYQKY